VVDSYAPIYVVPQREAASLKLPYVHDGGDGAEPPANRHQKMLPEQAGQCPLIDGKAELWAAQTAAGELFRYEMLPPRRANL
jgi:hypothetical protein